MANSKMGNDKKNKIIIIDDDEDLVSMLVFAFESKGYEVQSFSKGREALAFLLDDDNIRSARLIILDILLQDINGIDLLRELELKHYHLVPVLILSAVSSEKDVLLGLKKGAIDYIAKPFSLPILLEKAAELISYSSH